MVFLTSLDILDTGFLTVTSRTNQLASGNRVNSGNALRLKAVTFIINSSSNLDEGVTPANIPSDIKNHEKRALISVNPSTITLMFKINRLNTDTSNYYEINDASLLTHLFSLPHTRGFKALYYPVDNTTTDSGGNTSNRRNNQIIYQLGATDTSEAQGDIDITLWMGTTTASSKDLTDVNYIPVRFESCKITQVVSNFITIELTGVITG